MSVNVHNFLMHGVHMKSSRMLFLVATAMMSVVNAGENPAVIKIDQFFIKNGVTEQGESLLHLVARYYGNKDCEIRMKPYEVVETVISELKLMYPNMPDQEAANEYGKFLLRKNLQVFFGPDATGNTPLNIVNGREDIDANFSKFKQLLIKLEEEAIKVGGFDKLMYIVEQNILSS